MTERQERFVDEFLLTGSATESARRAGYSPKSARYQGCKLLRNVEVSKELEGRRQMMAREKIMTAEELQIFLSAVIRGEVKDEQLLTRLVGKGASVVESHEYRASVKDRLRATELLGKLIGAFDKKESTDASRLFISTLEKIYNAAQV